MHEAENLSMNARVRRRTDIEDFGRLINVKWLRMTETHLGSAIVTIQRTSLPGPNETAPGIWGPGDSPTIQMCTTTNRLVQRASRSGLYKRARSQRAFV
ncbi:hypothetical protein X947_6143 [Burkholderia pseudomallei MSHR7334]|nr:hypothetical protein X947_6143 [Burkholderia pseudomallei MSHR7334]